MSDPMAVAHDPMTRWKEIRKTSPSGKTMFVCMSCGLTSPSPMRDCRDRVKVNVAGVDYYMPCSAWPMTPAEYMESQLIEGTDSYFTGTVVLPDGGRIGISAPIPEAVAREIAVISIQYDLSGIRKEKKYQVERRMADSGRNDNIRVHVEYMKPPPLAPPLSKLIKLDDK